MKEIFLEDKPDTSVILPVQNDDAQFLMQTLDSLNKQEYKNFEIVVVLHGDAPISRQVLDRFSFDRRIVIHEVERVLSFGEALNAGHEVVRGRFITWAIPGNIYFEGFLSNLRIGLVLSEATHKQHELVYSDFQLLNTQGQIIQEVKHDGIDIEEKLKAGNYIGVSLMYAKSLYEKTGPYWDRPHETHQWFIRALQYTKFGLISIPLVGAFPRDIKRTEDDEKALEDARALASGLLKKEEEAVA